MAGIDLTDVPYNGGAPSIVALIAGETQLTITTVLLGLPHVKSRAACVRGRWLRSNARA